MAHPGISFYYRVASSIARFLRILLRQQVASFIHRRTYKAVPNPKYVVVIGGSFAGIELVKRLANSLPTGYSVLLMERNSHFNYTFAFPRFSVLPGHQHKAFIPYTGLSKSVPAGSLSIIQDSVVDITDGKVHLASGDTVAYEYLAIATGAWQPAPARLNAMNKYDACAELRECQLAIARASKIAIIGAGAVGVELAADTKSYFPGKDVTLVHSRPHMLNRFNPSLHDVVLAELEKLGVRVVLGQRPVVPQSESSFLASGVELDIGGEDPEIFDLVITCTGQSPNSSIIRNLMPDAIASNGYIHTLATLQVADEKINNVFALGDVADTGAAKMGRAGLLQSHVVQQNILKLIEDKHEPLASYIPDFMEGVLKLTVGKDRSVICVDDGEQALIKTIAGSPDDMEAKRVWWQFSANWKEAMVV